MNSQQSFEIPSTSEKIVKIVNAVPSHWSWLNGHLDAPYRFIADDLVQWDTGFSYHIEHCFSCNIVGRMMNNSGRRSKPDFSSVPTREKYCGFIEFEEADYENTGAKDVLIRFIKKGYYGSFSFSYGPVQMRPCLRIRKMYPMLEISIEGEEKEIEFITKVCRRIDARPYALCGE